MIDFLVSTDGACKGNPGPGTWAFVVFKPTGEYVGHKKGHKSTTTNNEQEITAIVNALTWANKNNLKIKILTDSSYCLLGISTWMHGWKKKGWKNASGDQVANLHLWQEAYEQWSPAKHQIEKVKGHSGNRYNDMADMYCNEEYLNKFF